MSRPRSTPLCLLQMEGGFGSFPLQGSGELTFPSSPSPGVLLLIMTIAGDSVLGTGFDYLKLEHS